MTENTRWIAPLIGLLLGAATGILWVKDLNSNPLWLYSMLGLGFGSLAALSWIYHRSGRAMSLGVALGVSVVLRLLALPLDPSLSNDVQRYLWDGHVVVSGENPYALAPADPILGPLRGGFEPSTAEEGGEIQSQRQQWHEVWQEMSHRTVETVYPPLAMTIFSIAASASDRSGVRALWLYKSLVVALDLLGCWLLFLVAKGSRIPLWRGILYAWNPLVVVEVAGMGHIDGAGLLPVALTLLLLERASGAGSRIRSLAAAALSAVAAVAVKLVPVVALAFWISFVRGRLDRRWFAFFVALFMVLMFLPVILSVGGVPPGLVTYGVSWEFNGPLFEPLYRLLQIGADDVRDAWLMGWAKAALGLLERLPGVDSVMQWVYPYVYPQFVAKVILAMALAIYLLRRAVRGATLIVGTRQALGAGLLCIATVYPWYLLWVLPWAGLTLSLPWLVASVSLTLAYLPRLFGIEYFPIVYLLAWSPPALALLFERTQSKRGFASGALAGE